MTRIQRATRTRVVAALVFAATTAACGAHTRPRATIPPGTSAWSLDRQPVPHNMAEALHALERGLGDANIARLRIAEEDAAITLVPTLGRWMEEHWGLAAGGPLAQYFEARGLDHPDDMAAVILTSFWRTLHFRETRLDEQIAWYRATRGHE